MSGAQRTEHAILIDHLGPETFDQPEARELTFNNVRRRDLVTLCQMYECEIDPNTPKLIGEGDRVTGIIPRMRNWVAEGRFDKVRKGQGNRPKSILEFRGQQEAARVKEREAGKEKAA